MENKPNKTRIHTQYKLENSQRVPSVTTVLGILAKPALLEWAWKCGVDGLDYKAVRDQAGGIGTLVHYLIMCDLKGEKPDTSEYSAQDIEKAETCLIKFWDWNKEHTLEPIMIETPLVSEVYRYGGTLDFFGIVNNELALVDFKTGKAIYPEHIYQVAAYRQLLLEKGHEVSHAQILRIGRNEDEGFEEQVITGFANAWELFLHCLAIYELQKEIRKGGT